MFCHARSIPLGTPAGLCDRPRQSRIVAAQRILAAENRILRAHLSSRLRLSDAERTTLAEIAKRLGRKALKDSRKGFEPAVAVLERQSRSIFYRNRWAFGSGNVVVAESPKIELNNI